MHNRVNSLKHGDLFVQHFQMFNFVFKQTKYQLHKFFIRNSKTQKIYDDIILCYKMVSLKF